MPDERRRGPRPSGTGLGRHSGLIGACIAIQACLFSSGGGKGNSGPQDSGYFAFSDPEALRGARLDSAYPVRWTSHGIGDGPVRLSVYQGDRFLGDLAADQPANGEYLWDLAATRSLGGYRLGSGPGYSLRLTDASDSSKWEQGPSFTIQSRFTGSLALTAPAQGARIEAGSSLGIAWTVAGDVGERVGLQVYKGGTLWRTLDTGLSASQGNYDWTAIPDRADTAGEYRIRIFALADPSLGQIGPAFGIGSDRSGSFRFLSPKSGDTLRADSVVTVAWEPQGDPEGATVYLCRDTAEVALILSTGMVPPPRSKTWAVPKELPSGRYRFRIHTVLANSPYFYSESFHIKAIDPDVYEPDDSRGASKAIVPDGIPQRRNLGGNDTDWIRFEAEAGKRYHATITSNYAYAVLEIADSAGKVLAGGNGKLFSVDHAPPRPGRHYLRIKSLSGTGPYDLSLYAYAAGQNGIPLRFTSPAADTVWSAASSRTVSWAPDTALFGENVSLALYRNGSLLFYLTPFAPGLGIASVSLPESLATGTGYSIRIAGYDKTAVYAESPSFSVKGMAPDPLEQNDSPEAAALIAPDSVWHPLSLSFHDRDWFHFPAHAGKLYTIRTVSPRQPGTLIKLWPKGAGDPAPVSRYGDSSNILSWVAPAEDGYLISVEASPEYQTGAYSLNVAESEASAYSFAVFAPAAGSAHHPGYGLSIQWRDPLFLRGNVDLQLYRGGDLAKTIAADVPNYGSHTWLIPSGFAAGPDYRVKIISRMSPAITGWSEGFSISP